MRHQEPSEEASKASPTGVSDGNAGSRREARRAARRAWPLRRYELGDEPGDDLSAHTTPAERLASVWSLTVLAWRLGGRSIPTYERSQMPGRIVRADTPR
jgi:hypothetical protein